ncbi:YbaN family protein [Thermodesulfovibrionales bacterium]|nr:YbaN family protein [Thermodesulfovibrionales bacterium]
MAIKPLRDLKPGQICGLEMKGENVLKHESLRCQKIRSGPFGRVFFIVAGTIFVGLAGIGILLPGVPQIVFLLLAVACYVRGSKRLTHWLLTNRLFGRQLEHVRKHGLITGRASKILKSWWFRFIVLVKISLLSLLLYHFFGGMGVIIILLVFIAKFALVIGSLYLVRSIWREPLVYQPKAERRSRGFHE